MEEVEPLPQAVHTSKDQKDSIRKAFALKQCFNAAVMLTNPALPLQSESVVTAAVLTLVVSLIVIIRVLTVFSRQWTVNFRISPSFMCKLFAVFGFGCLSSVLVPCTMVCACGVMLISAFIAIDTVFTVEGKHLGNLHYFLVAIMLFMDLMSLFLRITELLGKLNS